MKNPIQRAFDTIKAEPELIFRTQQALIEARSLPGFGRTGHRRPKMRMLATAMAVVLLTGIVAAAGLVVLKTPVAAVSLDINPSITLQVNALRRVISATGHNEAGRQLLDADLVNRPVQSAVARLIADAAAAGYLADDGSTIINITTSADAAGIKDKIGTETGRAAAAALKNAQKKAVIYQDYTGLDRVEEARSLDITPGRLNLIQKLVTLDDGTSITTYTAMDNQAIMKEVIALKKVKRDEEKASKKSEKGSDTTLSNGKPAGVTDPAGEESAILKMEQALASAQENARQNGQQNQGKGNNGQGNK